MAPSTYYPAQSGKSYDSLREDLLQTSEWFEWLQAQGRDFTRPKLAGVKHWFTLPNRAEFPGSHRRESHIPTSVCSSCAQMSSKEKSRDRLPANVKCHLMRPFGFRLICRPKQVKKIAGRSIRQLNVQPFQISSDSRTTVLTSVLILAAWVIAPAAH